MWSMTLQNHFEFERDFGTPDTFYVRVGEASLTHAPIFHAKEAAQHIHSLKSNGQKLILCLSGGIDSECMARAFLEAGVPFEVVFLKFQNRLNEYDIQTNVDFCIARNIPFKYIDLDIIDFFDSGKYFEIAMKYECQSPQLATHLWMLDQIDGVPCLSGNPIAPIWQKNRWFFVGLPGELHTTYFKYLMLNERAGVPWFFIYTPELIKSFFHLPSMKPYLNQQIQSVEQYTYEEKCKGYREAGFDVRPRHNKFTGFELVRDYYDQKYNTVCGMAFDEYFRRPLEKEFQFPDQYIQLVPQDYFVTHAAIERTSLEL